MSLLRNIQNSKFAKYYSQQTFIIAIELPLKLQLLLLQYMQRFQLEPQLNSGMHPRKINPNTSNLNNKGFYIFDTKIIKFTQFEDYAGLNMVLTDIAEPISKPAHINQYDITKASLLRAKALGYTSERVISFLSENIRNPVDPPRKYISERLYDLITTNMETRTASRIYLIEETERNYYVFEHNTDFILPPDIRDLLSKQIKPKESNPQSMDEQVKPSHRNIKRWEVNDYMHNELSKRLFEKEIPVLSEKPIERNQLNSQLKKNIHLYQNKGALHCKNLKIELKAFTKLRDYQSQALKAVVQQTGTTNAKVAKSGYIVLPCGAGKTLLGIAICAKIKKETLIVCSSDSGAEQWKRQIQKWTQGMPRQQIIIITSKTIDDFRFKVDDKKAYIFISTYSSLKAKLEGRQKEGEGKKQMKLQHQWMKLMPWGLIIFDEAQWLPAPANSLIANSLLAHVKIGLTATPLRQDQNIKSLIYMIGPQLYVGSWRKFVQNCYLANPKCIEIRTKLTRTFSSYFKMAQQKSGRQFQKESTFESNPNKIKTLIYLLKHHEALGDQIIVFCDKINVIRFLAQNLKIPLLSGDTLIQDRNFVFDMFREGKFKTVLLSRIGDEAIDLPNANVGIEINIHKGSRRQMLQRLGRIMRPKQSNVSSSYNAIFYTIVTDQTPQMHYFRKRRECLINLGFQYDLRFSEYGEEGVGDIIQDEPDKQLIKQVTQKYGQAIPNETQYLGKMRQK